MFSEIFVITAAWAVDREFVSIEMEDEESSYSSSSSSSSAFGVKLPPPQFPTATTKSQQQGRLLSLAIETGYRGRLLRPAIKAGY